MNKGLFITFEGCEGCGKTTVSRLVRENLLQLGYEVVMTREPGGTPISEKIREVLLDTSNVEMKPETEALLYAASRAQHTLEKIQPAVETGQIVLCDRYLDSSLAYQGYARNLGVDAVGWINDFGISGYRPDLVFFIDVPPEVGFRRMTGRKKDRLENENITFHKHVYDYFSTMAMLADNTIKIDGVHLTPAEEAKIITDKIVKTLEDKR